MVETTTYGQTSDANATRPNDNHSTTVTPNPTVKTPKTPCCQLLDPGVRDESLPFSKVRISSQPF